MTFINSVDPRCSCFTFPLTQHHSFYRNETFFSPTTSRDDCILHVGYRSDRCFILSFSVGREPDWKAVPQRLLETITEEDQVETSPVIAKGNLIYYIFQSP